MNVSPCGFKVRDFFFSFYISCVNTIIPRTKKACYFILKLIQGFFVDFRTIWGSRTTVNPDIRTRLDGLEGLSTRIVLSLKLMVILRPTPFSSAFVMIGK
jgi:hypothetical protein